MSLYDVNLQRTVNAVQMKPVDKTPFSYSGPAYLAKRQGLSIGEYLKDFRKATEAAVAFCKDHPGIDSIHSPTMNVYALSVLWMSEVKVPGVDLPANELWQLHEKEVMTVDDYQTILGKGYDKWARQYLKKQVGDPVPQIVPYVLSAGMTAKRLKRAGIPIMNGASIGSPIEGFCGGRQMINLFMDIMDEPELVKSAMDLAQKNLEKTLLLQIRASKPVAAWVGGWRAAPQLMSHDTFMEFVWPYIRRLVDICIAKDVVPVLHFDSCWERELETIKELPVKKCILMLDGSTDMRKARAVLDDRMCLMGDVPATMLAFGSAHEVYEYCTKLIDDVGPKTGLLLSSGCDCPMNAKDENVDAMIQASLDYRI